MKAKDYLEQLHRLDVIINQKIQEKADIRAMLANISSPNMLKERVQGGKLPGEMGFQQRVIKLIDIEEEIDVMMDEFVDLKRKIIGQIHDLDNADQIKVLYKRYVKFEKFEQIALDLNYCIRNVYLIHGQGLQEFEKMHAQK